MNDSDRFAGQAKLAINIVEATLLSVVLSFLCAFLTMNLVEISLQPFEPEWCKPKPNEFTNSLFCQLWHPNDVMRMSFVFAFITVPLGLYFVVPLFWKKIRTLSILKGLVFAFFSIVVLYGLPFFANYTLQWRW